LNKDIKGQCACGDIIHRIAFNPKFTIICQRRQCQRITGYGHSARFAIFAPDAFITSVIKYFSKSWRVGMRE